MSAATLIILKLAEGGQCFVVGIYIYKRKLGEKKSLKIPKR